MSVTLGSTKKPQTYNKPQEPKRNYFEKKQNKADKKTSFFEPRRNFTENKTENED